MIQIKEQNAIKKTWTSEKVKIGLLYPNTYRVAMTSLGVQLLYFLFNSWDNFICERIFKPLNPNVAPYSLENQKSLADFDIIAISCQFEHDYIQAIELLIRGGIDPDIRRRKEEDPLLICGGPSVTANPFSVLFLGDAFFLGDIEPISEEMMLAFQNQTKSNRIDALASIPGVIAYNHHYNAKSEWIGERKGSVKLKNLSKGFYPIKQIIPEGVKGTKNEPIFGKAFYLETDRGCSERCMFCYVGYCRFPRAARDLDTLIEIVDRASEENDFDKVVLYGSAIAQSDNLEDLIEHIVSKNYEVSCSSIRSDYLTEGVLKALRKGRQRTIALAPETGEEGLRMALNKRMSDESIFSSLKLAWETGFRKLKLYMIYGFPCEPSETKESTIEFVSKIRKNHFPTGKISISMNQFITKAQTPFQFASMLTVKESKSIQKWYRSQLYQIKNIQLSLYGPEWAIIQRIMSLRGHEYFPIIREIAEIGSTIGNWKKTLKQADSDLDYEANWKYRTEDSLPWDNIIHTIQKKTLISAYNRYKQQINCKD
ncbi:MAG: radical SAM protein [Candidatus Heimdallarchaeota archaeon]|nr:radical SAM protein [Candidatus Heimdallarchaeota archaeon]